MRDVADDTVSGIIEKVVGRLLKLDADALASLYSKNAFFYGLEPYALSRQRRCWRPISTRCRRWSSPSRSIHRLMSAPVGSRI